MFGRREPWGCGCSGVFYARPRPIAGKIPGTGRGSFPIQSSMYRSTKARLRKATLDSAAKRRKIACGESHPTRSTHLSVMLDAGVCEGTLMPPSQIKSEGGTVVDSPPAPPGVREGQDSPPLSDARVDPMSVSGEVTVDIAPAQSDAIESSPPSSDSAALIGTVILNRYRIEERIGRGGYGEVFAAENLALHTRVAIKILYSSFAPIDLQQFLRETKISAIIHHPNVVYVTDSGQLPDQRPFLVMELLEGESLETVIIKNKSIPPLRAVRIAIQIAHGLTAIHEKSIAHLDLKPQNVILIKQATDQDFVKILDFGIAQFVRSDSISGRKRSIGSSEGDAEPMIQGTPAYMSPEQIMGQPPSRLSDQFALGCILFRMLTGAYPFIGNSVDEVMFDRLYRDPPKASRSCLNTDITPELDGIIQRCMQPDPKNRYPDLYAIVKELEAVAQALQAPIHFPSQEQKSAQELSQLAVPVKSKRLYWYHLGWVLPTLISLVLTAWVQWRNDSARSPQINQQLRTARSEALATLTELTKNPRPEIRMGAVAGLSDSHEPATQATLRLLLNDQEPIVRVAAAAALAQFAKEDSLIILRSFTQQHVSIQVTIAAARALMHLGDRAGERELQAVLHAADQEGQLRAVLALCTNPSSEALAFMHRYVAATQPGDIVGIEILGCLAGTGDVAAREQLRLSTREDLPASVRIAAATRLWRSGDPMGADVLQALSRRPAFEQLVAARAIASSQYPATAMLFREVLRRPDAELASRQLAAEGIGEAGSSQDLELLLPLLGTIQDGAVRLAAAVSIVHIVGRDPALVSSQALAWAKLALSSPDDAVRLSALDVLATLQKEEGSVLIGSLLHDVSTSIRRRAVLSLGRQNAISAAVLLRGALKDPEQGVRMDAVLAIGMLARRLADTAPEQTRRMLSWLKEFLATAQSQQEQIVARGTLLASGDATQQVPLLGMLRGSSPELRVLLLAQLSKDVEALATYLNDPDFRVRFEAARHLAEQGDLRALPTLREALQQDTPESVIAHGLLQKIAPSRASMDHLLARARRGTVAQRIHIAQLTELLVSSDAHALMRILLNDADGLVRAAALTTLGMRREQLPEQGELLAMLLNDPDPALRNRAKLMQQVVTRIGSSSSRPQTTASETSTAPTRVTSPDLGAAQPPSVKDSHSGASTTKSTGQLMVKTTRSTLCAVDKGAWQSCDGKTFLLTSGGHKVTTLDGSQQVTITANQVAVLELPESRAEQLTRTGIDLLRRGDLRKGQKLLERVEAACAGKVQVGCQALLLDALLALGESYEGQGRLSDAMAAFQKASAHIHASSTSASAAESAKVAAAVARLAPRLGQVIILVGKEGQCRREVRWLPPGVHEVVLAGRPQSVTVRAQQSLSVGDCP